MTVARIARTMLGAFEAWVLESSALRAVILPELGGRVWELEDRIRGRQWIWNRGLENLKSCRVGTAYDDVWAGGWEELFPNDAAGTFEGRELPDHGEWWASVWQVASDFDGAQPGLRLESRMSIIKAACSKEFQLSPDGATLTVRYRIRSEEQQPFHFLFKQHLPIRLTADCELQLPGGKLRAVDPRFGTRITGNSEYDWPTAWRDERPVDLRPVPPDSSRQKEFWYVRDLPQPWCGFVDRRLGASIRLQYDATSYPYVWLFLTFGGWRGHYTGVLEPCTNMPKELAEAVRRNQSARLDPGGEFSTQVSVTLCGSLPNGDLASHNSSIPRLNDGDRR